MQTFNSMIYRLLFVVFCFISFAQLKAQSQKKLYQSFAVQTATTVALELGDFPVEVRETEGPSIFIEGELSVTEIDEQLLSFLVQKGRYKLQANYNTSCQEIKLAWAKELSTLMKAGEVCEEQIKFVLYLPKGLKINDSQTISASR